MRNRGKRIVWEIVGALLLLALLAGGALHYLRTERDRVQDLPVLMYHMIGESGSVWWVHADEFRAHMRSLHEQGYATVTPADIVAKQKWGKPLPEKPVMITFDDGFQSLLTEAEPVLKEFGFQGVAYLATGLLRESETNRVDYRNAAVLIWPEICDMAARGTFVFGGHSHRHMNLVAAKGRREDIARCAELLREHLGRVGGFCYPYGQFNETAIAYVREAGFTSAVACEDELAQTGPELDLFQIVRVSVYGGEQTFSTAVDAGDAGTVRVRISKAGQPRTATPRLVWPGIAEDEGWQDRFRAGPLEETFNWTVPKGIDPARVGLQIWDKHRILQLHPM